MSFARCHSVLCHSLQCEPTFILKGIKKHPTVDEPFTSWTVCGAQDILVSHLLPRNAQSSCAYVRCACLCVTEETSLRELHDAGAASRIMCFTVNLFIETLELKKWRCNNRTETVPLPDFPLIRRSFNYIYLQNLNLSLFFTCQPSSGLKQLITEFHQQVLTVNAQKDRANSEEDASSHHPLKDRFPVTAQ